jgi:hypothetical protein
MNRVCAPFAKAWALAAVALAAVTVAVTVAGCAKTAAPSGPLAYVRYAAQIVPLSGNRMLVTDFGSLDRQGGQVLITNFAHRLLWKYTGKLVNPHSAYPTPNGDIIIADTGNNRVIIVNRRSRILWNSDDLGGGRGRLGQGRLSDGTHLVYPNDAKPLSGGRIMISCRLQSRVVIINRSGTILRDVSGMIDRQHNPHLLPNGDMLIADSSNNRIVQVNRQSHIVWSFGGGADSPLNWPRDATILPNGNILITDSDNDRLVEVTRSHRIVKTWTGLQRPYCAAVLPNGDILARDGPSPGIVELNHRDQIIWRLNRDPNWYLRSYPATLQNGSFEQAATGNTPAHWQREDALAYSIRTGSRVPMVRDGAVHEAGKYSARITYHGNSDGVYLSQTVRVQPGKTYAFSGWIKTHKVTACHPCRNIPSSPPGSTAQYSVKYVPGQGNYPPLPSLPQFTGTVGWEPVSATFTVPPAIYAIEIDAFLRGQGTVWFDNVSLRPAA